MSAETRSSHTGRKIGYGLVIGMCGLVILLSLVGALGTWVVGSRLSAAVTQVLVVVENTAGSLRATVAQVDQRVANLEETALTIRSAADQLNQNITDRGLVLTLLPEEREQELVAQANDLQETVDSVVDALNAGLELYQTIDRLPFVSLPRPDPEIVANLQRNIADIRSMVTQIVEGVRAFREGVAQRIDQVISIVDEVSATLSLARQNLGRLDSALLGLQDTAVRLRSLAPQLFTLLSVVLTLFLAWIIYTQVVVIRQYTRRWKNLEVAVGEALPGGSPLDAQPVEPSQAEMPPQASSLEDAIPAAAQEETEPAIPPEESLPPAEEQGEE